MSFLYTFILYVFLIPFSAVTVIVKLLAPYFNVLVPVPLTLAVLTSLLAVIFIELELTLVTVYDVVFLLKVGLNVPSLTLILLK